VELSVSESTTRFGGVVPAALDGRLLEAARSYANTSRAESLLLDAHKLDPECLPVYFSLYKFYFYSHRLHEAKEIVLAALATAARQAKISSDWSQLTKNSAAWNETSSPAHFYLFSLRALAFIYLRLGRHEEANSLLDKLLELDTGDGVGASVVRSLAAAVTP
jgi:tetratricopeptide (TPR) repeat protein